MLQYGTSSWSKLIDIPVKVACGHEHTIALTDKGEIYTWGKNNYGPVGVNNKMQPSGPIMVNSWIKIKKLFNNCYDVK